MHGVITCAVAFAGMYALTLVGLAAVDLVDDRLTRHLLAKDAIVALGYPGCIMTAFGTVGTLLAVGVLRGPDHVFYDLGGCLAALTFGICGLAVSGAATWLRNRSDAARGMGPRERGKGTRQ